MAIGKRKSTRQEDLWVATSELTRSAGHPFYERVNGLLAGAGFDAFVEGRCAKFYAEKMGRPGLAPSVCNRHANRAWTGPRPLRRSWGWTGEQRFSGGWSGVIGKG